MLKKAALLLVFLFPSQSHSRWNPSDLDPFNRHSGIRKTFSNLKIPELSSYKHKALARMGRIVADNPEFKSKARTEGWTIEKCRTAGTGIAAVIAGFQGTGICAAYVAGEPLSTSACVGLIVASGATITEIACTQLCNDRHLRDC